MNQIQATTQELFSRWRSTLSNQNRYGSKESFTELYESLQQNPGDLELLNLTEQQLQKLEIAKEFHCL